MNHLCKIFVVPVFILFLFVRFSLGWEIAFYRYFKIFLSEQFIAITTTIVFDLLISGLLVYSVIYIHSISKKYIYPYCLLILVLLSQISFELFASITGVIYGNSYDGDNAIAALYLTMVIELVFLFLTGGLFDFVVNKVSDNK